MPLGALAALVFGLAVPAYVLAATPGPRNPGWLGALVVLVLVGVRYSWIVGRGEQRLVEMTVWLFTYVFLGLAPLVQLREGVSPETTPEVYGAFVAESLLVVGLGSLSFAVGCGLRTLRSGGRGARLRTIGPAIAGNTQVGVPRGLRWLGLGSLLLTAYYLVQVAPALFTSVDQLGAQMAAVWPNTATQGIVQALAIMPLLVTVVSMTLLRLRRPRPVWTTGEQVVYWTAVVALVVTVNPLNSPRYVFGTVALSLAGALGLYATGRRFRAVAVGAVLGLLVVFPVADAFRDTSTPGGIEISPLSALEGGDFDAFAQIDNTLLYVDQYGTTEGRQALGVALFWVPRAVWTEKPEDTGVLLADFRDYSFDNLSAPLWAELFINGGWVAVGIGGLAFGWWARGRDDAIVTRLRRSRAPGVVDCILPFYFVFLLRGSLLQAMANLVVMLACAWFADRVTREHLAVDAPARSEPASA
ncbi:hypothetical protein [Klenkia terrae]|uniref:hypothetical protein n=1 Tax=Klenkia terrae TaxID=1052259 RepID=UPI001CD84558|nr:hypothetical protein [Klenkia terrae]